MLHQGFMPISAECTKTLHIQTCNTSFSLQLNLHMTFIYVKGPKLQLTIL